MFTLCFSHVFWHGIYMYSAIPVGHTLHSSFRVYFYAANLKYTLWEKQNLHLTSVMCILCVLNKLGCILKKHSKKHIKINMDQIQNV